MNGTNGLEHIRAILQRLPLGQEAPRRAWKDFGKEWDCSHASTVLRVKTNAAGLPMYGNQCVRCGEAVGSWLKKTSIPDLRRVPPWDEGLRDQFFAERDSARRETETTFALAQEEKSREWWAAYNEYLQTAHWQRVRRKVLDRAKYVCEGCQEARATQVHHVSYDHIGDELLWELRAVCQGCHEKVHPHMRGGQAA